MLWIALVSNLQRNSPEFWNLFWQIPLNKLYQLTDLALPHKMLTAFKHWYADGHHLIQLWKLKNYPKYFDRLDLGMQCITSSIAILSGNTVVWKYFENLMKIFWTFDENILIVLVRQKYLGMSLTCAQLQALLCPQSWWRSIVWSCCAHEHLMMIALYHCVIISCTNIWGWSQYMYHCHGQPSMQDTSGNDVIWVKIFGLWLFNVHHHHCVISGWSNGKYNFAQVLRSTAPRPPFIWKASALDWWASNKLTHKLGARQMGPKPDLGAYQRTWRF